MRRVRSSVPCAVFGEAGLSAAADISPLEAVSRCCLPSAPSPVAIQRRCNLLGREDSAFGIMSEQISCFVTMRAEEGAPGQGNRDTDAISFPGFCPSPLPRSPWAARQGGSPFAAARSTTAQPSHLAHLPSAPLTFYTEPSRTFAPSIASTLGGSSGSLTRRQQPSLPPITADWLAAALTATMSPKRRPTPGGSPEPQYDISNHSTNSSNLVTAGVASLLEISPDVGGAAAAGGIEDVLGILAAGGGGGGGGFGGGGTVPPGCRLRRVRRVTSDLNCLVECPSVSCR